MILFQIETKNLDLPCFNVQTFFNNCQSFKHANRRKVSYLLDLFTPKTGIQIVTVLTYKGLCFAGRIT